MTPLRPSFLSVLSFSLSFSRLKAQIIKELLCILRDPKARALLVMPPLVQLFVFAFAATLEVSNTSVMVYNRDGGRWSQELITRIESASFVGHLQQAQDARQLHAALEGRKALLVVEIPDDFSARIAAGKPASLQVIIDGRRANAGQIALSYLEQISSRLEQDMAVTSLQSEPVAIRHHFNPNLIYHWFIVPNLAGTLSMLIALMVTALSIARERELGTFDQLLVSPCTPTEIILAKMLPALLIGTSLGMLMVGVGVFLFGIPFTGSLGLLLLCMLLFILSIVGMGLMISAICATQQQAILGTFALSVTMIMISGFATPVENMPPFLQGLAQLVPLKHFLVILQGSFLKALPFREILANVWPMALIALVTLTAATLLVRSKLQ